MAREKTGGKLDYGFGASKYVTYALVAIGIIFATLAIAFTVLESSTWVLILFWILAIVAVIAAVIWHILAGFPSSPEKIEQFHGDFLDHLASIWDGKGKVLDIGTGSGRAAIEIARRFPEAQVIGIDIWPKNWRLFGISKEQAESNARIEQVHERCVFQRGSAVDIPFEDSEYQLVVSSLVFHQIKMPDRTDLFKEAIRVLAPGGVFMICDIFRSVKEYRVRDISELLRKIEELGTEKVGYRSLQEAGLKIGSLIWFWKVAYLHGRKINTG